MTDVDQDDVGYVLGVNLSLAGLGNIGADVIGIDTLGFEVDPGHRQDVTFDFSSLVTLDLLDGLRIAVQKLDPTTGQWSSIAGSAGSATLLSLGLLGGGGTGVTIEGLTGGEYRAFVTNEGGLAVGLTIGSILSATAVDFDYTNIAGYEAVPAEGNVLANDDLPPETFVQSVNGQAIDPAAPITISGEYGQLTVSADGSYTYTPFAAGAGIGQVDQFEYVVADGAGNTATATLNVQIGSGDVDLVWDPDDPTAAATPVFAAGADTADAAVVWQNVVDNDYFTVGNGALIGAGAQTFTSGSFVITDGMDISGNVVVSTAVGLANSGTIFVERQDASGGWSVVAQNGYSVVAGVLGPIGSLNLDNVAFEEGTYRVRVTGSSLLSLTRSVAVDVNVVYEDQFVIADSVDGTGNLLANDTTGSPFTTIAVLDGDTYVDVAGTVTIAGTYGDLTVDADGLYTYQIRDGIDHFATAQQEVFTYQLVNPTGAVETGMLTVTVDPSGAGVPVVTLASLADDDVIGIDALDDSSQAVDDDAPGQPEDDADIAAMMEAPATEDEISLEGLSLLAEPDDADADLSEPGEAAFAAETADIGEATTDPFAHLASEDDWDRNQGNSI